MNTIEDQIISILEDSYGSHIYKCDVDALVALVEQARAQGRAEGLKEALVTLNDMYCERVENGQPDLTMFDVFKAIEGMLKEQPSTPPVARKE